jgi:hypothetical protein
MSSKSTYEATLFGIRSKLNALIIETHNTARELEEANSSKQDINSLRDVADSISALESSIRKIKFDQ